MMTKFEDDLRRQLKEAADGALKYRWQSLERPGEPAEAVRRSPAPRWSRRWAAAAAAAVVAAGGVGVWSWVATQRGGVSEAACAAELKFDGNTYSTVGELLRTPRAGQKVGVAHEPSCDDGDGPSGSASMSAFKIPGVPLKTAFFTNGDVWVNGKLTVLPDYLRVLYQPVACTASGHFAASGQFTAVNKVSGRRGQIAPPPYVITFVADRGTFPPLQKYASLSLKIRVTNQTIGGRSAKLMIPALRQGRPLTVEMFCDGGRFVATALRPAG
ncbi:DUF6281 family protein [Segeticoccus rhizosphaerae]|jgi:hypothetical protein|uniref:DUF6281 family protein n=1 Tax=Segeticoccus rhizosphaerae TaxID=1104777 RepID=UPI0010C07EF7|nr:MULTISPECIES: DUF6281 family protein [Intrasporangiaceae]